MLGLTEDMALNMASNMFRKAREESGVKSLVIYFDEKDEIKVSKYSENIVEFLQKLQERNKELKLENQLLKEKEIELSKQLEK